MQWHFVNLVKNFTKEEIMIQLSGLTKRHKNLSDRISKLEKERRWNRTFNHKSELVDLKKEKLRIKEKIKGIKDV
ncbi:MAG: hypothetical protein CBC05_02135 [Crocinitomicaceae bacterium TMED45]|nr:MAG: hypothetical protein CBC05_02135 [Crocinitomicaceae bacterium TMED45]